MRVLVCGDRNYTGWARIKKELEGLIEACADHEATNCSCSGITIIHGAARGADTIAACIASRLGFKVIPYPADWERFGRAAGPVRNRWMADSGPDLVLAFHHDISNSKGTKNMVELARKRNIQTLVIDD